ncbi:hypothetical protein GGTG_14398 [Gaeumannomyces tritici R3-111a-1]|uniref:Uncharacterized protein n=1 Tax=Gaeumannomyces tritici (strain R3-111a-1) TaxID=644352 RepID=J3PLD3_GAET3|nr:hypothetical protein GGTG_14398 [Gaeumannomyces tritici R3-111a-1]EJT68025.1 hypothetical protein GGTG_14398 [Gaeumannomyces tritici R3-111a-1]
MVGVVVPVYGQQRLMARGRNGGSNGDALCIKKEQREKYGYLLPGRTGPVCCLPASD